MLWKNKLLHISRRRTLLASKRHSNQFYSQENYYYYYSLRERVLNAIFLKKLMLILSEILLYIAHPG